jgi:hypothetical protein
MLALSADRLSISELLNLSLGVQHDLAMVPLYTKARTSAEYSS